MRIKKRVLFFLGAFLCIPLGKFLQKMHSAQTTSHLYTTHIDASHLAIESTYVPCDPVCTGYTPLMMAAMKGDIQDTKKLIALGVPLDMLSQDIDQSTERSNNFAMQDNTKAQYLNNTALHIAIYNTNFPAKINSPENFSIAQLLINAGANVRIHNNRGDTPMHYIMQRVYRIPQLEPSNMSEREALMQNLILHGADINAQNNQGYTMLHLAIFNGEGEWIKRLLDTYGSIVDFHAKAHQKSCNSMTALAPSNKPCEFLTPLQLAGDQAGNSLGGTYVRSVLLNDNTSAPEVLESRVKPKILGANERDVMGMTGFMLAVIWEGSQKLKNSSYDPSLDDHKNFTVDKLIQEVADLNATTACLHNPCNSDYDLQNTVLHITLLHQIPDMLQKILENAKKLGKNIDVNKQNIKGDTPLHYILKLDNVDLKNPAEREKRNKESREKALNILMDHGGNINIQNSDGNTLLHLATKTHATSLVKYLLDHYNTKGLSAPQLINLSLRNKDGLAQGAPLGKTALDLARALHFEDIASLLTSAEEDNQKLLNQPKVSQK